MQAKLLKEYHLIEEEYKLLEEKRRRLREKIVISLKKDGVDKVESDFGSFTIAHRLSWVYSKAIGKIEEKLKIAKTKEQQKGLAKSSETEYLVYKPVNLEN